MKSIQFTVPSLANKSFYIQEDVMNEFYPHFHRHTETQIMWILKGQGSLVLEEGLFNFSPGDIFYLAANQSHVFKADFRKGELKEIHTISLFFDLKNRLQGIFEAPELQELKNFLETITLGFKLPKEVNKEISVQIRKIQHEQEELNTLFLFMQLLQLLKQQEKKQIPMRSGNKKENQPTESDLRMYRANKFVNENYLNPNLTLSLVAEQASLTPQAFCRSFKKHTGITYVNYLNQLRIQHTCKLMIMDYHCNIATAAFQSGFNSLTTFNRVFKQLIKLSPTAYIKRYREITKS